MQTGLNSILRPLLPLLLVLPVGAWAQENEADTSNETDARKIPLPAVEDEVNLGVYYLNKDSFRFGKYTGLTDQGGYLLFDFRVEKRPDWDSGDTTRWRLEGWRMGLDSRRLLFDYLQQGKQRFKFDYRQIPNNNWNDGRTIYRGVGGGSLTLPGDWEVVPGSDNTEGFTKLLPSLSRVEMRTERKAFNLNYVRDLNPGWNMSVDFKHEIKDGTRATWGVIGNSGGNPRAVGITAPVDWTTDNLEALVSYALGNVQFGAGIYASVFSNDQKSVSWENAYGQNSGWAPGVGFPDGVGRMALEPDNSYVQLKTYGGLNLSKKTRLTADLSYGTMKQDDAFFPYTVNPRLSTPVALPRDNADAKIAMLLLNARLSSQLADNLILLVNYRYDDRDNKTPRAGTGYAYVGGDSQNQKSASSARLNLPYSYREQKLDATLKWRAARGTSVTGGLSWQDYQRTFAEVEDANEYDIHAGIRLTKWQTSSLSFNAKFSDRDADDYVDNRPFQLSHVPGSVDPDDFENHPLLRKYNQFDRKRTELRLRYDWFPNPQVNLGVTGLSADEEYSQNTFGLNDFSSRSLTLDGGWYPNRNVALTGFFTKEKWDAAMSGRSFRNAGQANDPRNDWRNDSDDDVDTLNLDLSFKNMGKSEAMHFGVSYTLSKVKSDVSTTGGSSITTAPLPNLVNKMQTLKLYGGYRLNKKSTVELAAEWSRLGADDYGLDDVAPNTMENVLSFGQSAQGYDIWLLSAYWRREF